MVLMLGVPFPVIRGWHNKLIWDISVQVCFQNPVENDGCLWLELLLNFSPYKRSFPQHGNSENCPLFLFNYFMAFHPILAQWWCEKRLPVFIIYHDVNYSLRIRNGDSQVDGTIKNNYILHSSYIFVSCFWVGEEEGSFGHG